MLDSDQIIIAKNFSPIERDNRGSIEALIYSIPEVGATIQHEGKLYKIFEVRTQPIVPVMPGELPKMMAEFKVREVIWP